MPRPDREGRAIVSCRAAAAADGHETVSRRQFLCLEDAIRHVMCTMAIADRDLAWIICADGYRLDFREIADLFERPGEAAMGTIYVI